MSKGKFYITTAIAYTSRKPHIGNSYEIVLTDAIARYKRLQGYDVFFLIGSVKFGSESGDGQAQNQRDGQKYCYQFFHLVPPLSLM